MRLAKLVSLYSLVFAASALLTAACIKVEYSDVAFRCRPSMTNQRCPENYICCSDDPMALSIDEDGKPLGSYLPGYGDHEEEKGYATPRFSGENNDLSSSGMCIKKDALSPDASLSETGAQGCPIPCSPLWDDDERESVCGKKSACCQTVELDDKDCVMDPDKKCYRPARGTDIFAKTSDWSTAKHVTHQDPGGKMCGQLFDSGDEADQWRACLQRLTVADARGFCVDASETDASGCPDWEDACERLNDAQGLECD